jgi:hypothetical protein
MSNVFRYWIAKFKSFFLQSKRKDIVLNLSPLPESKLPKIIYDDAGEVRHKFAFTEAEVNEFNIFRKAPYPKAKREPAGKITSHSSQEVSL